MFRWSEDTTLKFVTQYLQHECLWNIKSPLYKNKQTKQSAYVNLENAMNISGFGEKEIKLKIKNIRSTYTQELKKIKDSKKSGAGTDTLYVPSIKWFNILDGSLRNITSTLTESESNLPSEEVLVSTDIGTSTDSNSDRSAVDSIVREPKPQPKPPPTKKKRLSHLTSMVSQLKEIADTANAQGTAEETEFDVFGKHIALQLKGMPLLLALQTQEHIQLYLNRIRRQHLQDISERNTDIRSSTPLSTPLSYDSQDSSYGNNSIPYNDNHYYEETLFSPPSIVTSQEQSVQEIPFKPRTEDSNLNDILFEAMKSADV